MKTITTDDIINRFKSIWGDCYDYSKTIYSGSSNKVVIICDIHGEYLQLPANHCKYGCGLCKENKRNKLLKDTSKKEFISKANNIHNYKYLYNKSIYINAVTKLIVTCEIHGDFEITPNNHLRNRGCRDCGIILHGLKRRTSWDEYHEKFIKYYKDKYDYSKVIWEGSSKKIDVICKIHGLFKIIPWEHIKGKQCINCSNTFSKMSIQYLNYMEVKTGKFINHSMNIGEYTIPNSRYKADGFCEETNTIYEFLGDFWHGNPVLYEGGKINPKTLTTYGYLYKKTLERKEFIKNCGYNYVEIWEYDWKKFIKIITRIQKMWKKK